MQTEQQRGFYEALGARIRSARLGANVTQASLADRVKLSRASIANIEKGRQNFSVIVLCQIADELHTAVASLVPPPQNSGGDFSDSVQRADLSPKERNWIEGISSSHKK